MSQTTTVEDIMREMGRERQLAGRQYSRRKVVKQSDDLPPPFADIEREIAAALPFAALKPDTPKHAAVIGFTESLAKLKAFARDWNVFLVRVVATGVEVRADDFNADRLRPIAAAKVAELTPDVPRVS